MTALPKKMKAARFYAPRDVRVEQVALPALKPGELLLKMEAALTCGTDLKCFKRDHPVLLGQERPAPFGHEGCGRVVDMMLDPELPMRVSVGQRVVAANSAPCHQCFFCHKKQYNLCEHLVLLNGTYAEYMVIPANIARLNTYAVPDSLDPFAAAFAEPLAIALRGVELSGVKAGDHIAIFGLGAIGQLMIMVARWKGAHVSAIGRGAFRRNIAEQVSGADVVLDIREFKTPQALIASHTPAGRGFDVVIEAVGLPETWESSLQMVRRGGVVNLYGGCPAGSTITVDTRRLHYDEITVLSLFHHTPQFFKQAVDLLVTGQLNPLPLMSAQFELDAVCDALGWVEAGKAVKAGIKPQQA